MLHSLYRGLTYFGGPAVRLYLGRRRAIGKEDPARQNERLGFARRVRPPGRLVWIHAASVGEANSALILVERLLALADGIAVLVTTGTVSSARIMGHRLPGGAVHQFVPVDLPAAAERFLDHWRPDLVVWIESEIWPNLLNEIRRRGIPAALVNARMSARSFARWRYAPRFAASLLATFQLVLAQTGADRDRLATLGAGPVVCVGNLKFSAPPPPGDPVAEQALAAAVAGRPVWLFASTHEGEDALAADTHARLATRWPELLTMIAPRHAERGGEIAALMAARGLTLARRSAGRLPTADHAVYLADTMGELGTLYRVVPVVCMGGSFVRHGGQNPIEPAQLGAAVLYGPHMWNFAEITQRLEAAGGAKPLVNADQLAQAVDELLVDGPERQRLVAGARRVTGENRQIVESVLAALEPLLAEAGLVATKTRPAA